MRSEEKCEERSEVHAFQKSYYMLMPQFFSKLRTRSCLAPVAPVSNFACGQCRQPGVHGVAEGSCGHGCLVGPGWSVHCRLPLCFQKECCVSLNRQSEIVLQLELEMFKSCSVVIPGSDEHVRFRYHAEVVNCVKTLIFNQSCFRRSVYATSSLYSLQSLTRDT